jgi:hypothetical protein
MSLTYIQSTQTGKIYGLLPEAAEKQLKSGHYRKVDKDRVARITASTVRYGN